MKKKYVTIAKYVALGLMILIFNTFVNSDMLIKNNVEYINLNNSANLYYNEKLVQVGNINKYYIKDAQYGDSIRIEKRIQEEKTGL